MSHVPRWCISDLVSAFRCVVRSLISTANLPIITPASGGTSGWRSA